MRDTAFSDTRLREIFNRTHGKCYFTGRPLKFEDYNTCDITGRAERGWIIGLRDPGHTIAEVNDDELVPVCCDAAKAA